MRIEITNAAGVRYGDGPIMSATKWSNHTILDAAGQFSFEMPLGDPRAALIQDKRHAWCYDDDNELIGAGIVEQRRFRMSAGVPMLQVSGDDLLSELADLPVGALELYTTSQRAPDYVLLWEDGSSYVDWSSYLCDSDPDHHRSYKLGPEDAILVGDADPFDRLEFGFDGYWNSDGATVTLGYWDGSDWAECAIISDDMNVDGVPFSRDGVIRFERHGDWTSSTIDSKSAYWLKISVSENLDNTSDMAWGYIDVIQELADPTPLADIFALSVVSAKGWSLDTDVPYKPEAENGFYGRFLSGQSVLEALRAIAAQTGEHFRLGTGRKIQWLGDDENAAAVRAVRDTGSPRIWDNDDVAIITELEYVSDSYELVTRIYPYGDSIDLSDCTRTPPAGYTLDTANNCIVSSAQETALGGYRCDRTKRWREIGAIVSDVTADVNASNALYDVALAWLQAHDRAITTVQTKLIKVAKAVLPGEKLTVDFHSFVGDYEMVDIADSYWVLEVENSIDANGIRTCSPLLASSDYRPVTDAEEMADLVSSVGQISGGGGVTTVVASDQSTLVEQGARVYRSTTQSISHNTMTAISFDAVVHDTDGCWTSGAPTKLYAKHAGYYVAGGQMSMTMGATAADVLLVVREGGNNYLAQSGMRATASTEVALSVSTGMVWLDVDDYVEIVVRQIQTSGSAALDLSAASGSYQQFNNGWLQRIA